MVGLNLWRLLNDDLNPRFLFNDKIFSQLSHLVVSSKNTSPTFVDRSLPKKKGWEVTGFSNES